MRCSHGVGASPSLQGLDRALACRLWLVLSLSLSELQLLPLLPEPFPSDCHLGSPSGLQTTVA